MWQSSAGKWWTIKTEEKAGQWKTPKAWVFSLVCTLQAQEPFFPRISQLRTCSSVTAVLPPLTSLFHVRLSRTKYTSDQKLKCVSSNESMWFFLLAWVGCPQADISHHPSPRTATAFLYFSSEGGAGVLSRGVILSFPRRLSTTILGLCAAGS